MYTAIILAAAKAAKVSGTLLLAICMQETTLKNVIAHEDGGSPSYGICQVKLATAQMLGYKGDGQGLMVPKTNAKYAALYLAKQKARYNNDWCKATAAYNAGKFNASETGKPRNIKYVKGVKSRLTEEYRLMLTCESQEKVAWNVREWRIRKLLRQLTNYQRPRYVMAE